MKTMFTLEEAQELLLSDNSYMVAGDETLLRALPKGSWVGGTIPYFMGDEGGVCSAEKIYVQKVPDIVGRVKIRSYTADQITNFTSDGFMTGYSYILIPGFSDVHVKYAVKALKIPGIFDRPVIGWISGVNVNDVGKITPKVFNGETGDVFDDRAIVMHTEFRDNRTAIVDIINLFKQDDGDEIIFEQDGFEIDTAFVNGVKVDNFAKYILSKNADLSLPVTANFNGVIVNNSFRDLDLNTGRASFFAPVLAGIKYKRAKPIDNYVEEFEKRMHKKLVNPAFSCNCVHNYIYAELEGKKSGHFKGPMTFGEIAYILLNRTLVYLTV